MAIAMENYSAIFTGVTYEDEIASLRDYLQFSAPASILFDFSDCDDVHLGVLQLVLAYKKQYSSEYRFGGYEKLYQKVCEGFECSPSYCG
jgi:hypothetical protein